MKRSKSQKTLVALVGGARPNFMKLAPLARELKRRNTPFFVVDTGQHFSRSMSKDIIKEFGLPIHHKISPSRASVVRQMADVMEELEKLFLRTHPSLVVVVGDVNSTLAAAIVANKLNIPLVHVEAGLRSYNRAMPEEHNRIMVDHISDVLLVTQPEGKQNLCAEGITKNVYVVGNIMIDTLVFFERKISKTKERFYFSTIHRAENVDRRETFKEIIEALAFMARDEKIYLSLHPRTKLMAERFGLMKALEDACTLLPPLSYSEALFYQKNAKLVLTDSGGIQEEASYLGTPCITLRTETERPITVTLGTNTIGGITKRSILRAYRSKKLVHTSTKIPLWDGRAASRMVDILIKKQWI